ncbi:MAG: Flp pilus assembly protein CpaB [Rhizobiaceae bacterium]
MKPIQLILLAVALVAAIGAGFLMMNLNKKPKMKNQVVIQEKVEPIKRVLIAKNDVPMGTALTQENLVWEEWPEKNIREAYIVEDDNKEAIEKYSKAIARTAFYAGEPIREEKIVHSDSGYLSAILPAGKRAMAINVSAETSAGGFVLPNDHVDVIISYKGEDKEAGFITETILQNIRVLAVDRVLEEQDGEKSIVGRTITLELTATQSEIIVAAKKVGRNSMSLALRSVEDSELASSNAGESLLSSGSRKRRGTVRIILYGKPHEVRPKN